MVKQYVTSTTHLNENQQITLEKEHYSRWVGGLEHFFLDRSTDAVSVHRRMQKLTLSKSISRQLPLLPVKKEKLHPLFDAFHIKLNRKSRK